MTMSNNQNYSPAPAYTVASCSSTVVPKSTTQLSEIAGFVENGHLIVWQFHAVFYLKVINGVVQTPPNFQEDLEKYLVRARAFNAEKEWHLWRANQKIYGRQRTDTKGEGSRFVEADLKLRGVIYLQLGGADGNSPVFLQTRNYYTHNQHFQAGYIDQRFTGIHPLKEEQNEE